MTEAKTSTFQTEDGVKLFVKFYGDPSDKAKPLIIGLHGAPGLNYHVALDGLLSKLSATFRVLVFDGRGSGASDKVGPYTHERWIKDIELLRTWAGAEKFVLVGHSYGGFLALDYAVNHPARLSGLVLIDTWTVGTLGQMGAAANALTSDRVKPDKARQLRVWSGNLLSDQDYQDGITEILPFYDVPEDVAKKNPSTAVKPPPLTPEQIFAPGGPLQIYYETQNFAFGYNMPRFDVRKQLKDITSPTLITVGRYDYVTPLSFAEEMERGIADSRLEIFEYSGHSPYLDEPEKFDEVLVDFLKTKVL